MNGISTIHSYAFCYTKVSDRAFRLTNECFMTAPRLTLGSNDAVCVTKRHLANDTRIRHLDTHTAATTNQKRSFHAHKCESYRVVTKLSPRCSQQSKCVNGRDRPFFDSFLAVRGSLNRMQTEIECAPAMNEELDCAPGGCLNVL